MQMLTHEERVRRLRPANNGKRIRREKRTIDAMLDVYCHDHHGDLHGTAELCDECARLRRYARQRLDNCVFGEAKMPCNCCAVHCYSAKMRGLIVDVMRYSGPRMMFRYPVLSFLHLFDKMRAGGG
ncbi:MAG: nitrous oxide-stimulated promoter family protein [Thiohalocapsa sp.]